MGPDTHPSPRAGGKKLVGPILGSGGKDSGGSQHTPVEAANTLKSVAYAKVMDLVSEGPIEGPALSGLKWVFLDGTPIENSDGTYNFKGVNVAWVPGTQSQDYISGFEDTQNEVSDGREILFDTPRVFTITNTSVTTVRVTIGFPQLSHQDVTTGDTNGNSVDIYIDVQTNGGGYIRKISDTVKGKCMSMYEKAYSIPLTGTGPWDIRVSRSANGVDSYDQKKTYLNRYTEVVNQKFSYPNSAIVATQVDSSQLDKIPTRGYLLKLLKVLVPVNYDPVARTYTGSWDGTFKLAWTDNPAWCFYDLATNTRYGAGRFLAGKVDKWSLYTIGKYCDELVPVGDGTTSEPRFTCNAYFQTSEKAYTILANLASVFRGMIFSSSGNVGFIQDAPASFSAVFTKANIKDKFEYTGSPLTQRHSVAMVKYVDPLDGYTEKVVYVEDKESLKRYGYNPTDLTALACTSKYQAYRMGKYVLATERTEPDMVVFQTDLHGANMAPGSLFYIQDSDRSGKSLSGRTKDGTTSSVIQIDREVVIENGKTYTLVVLLPDGNLASGTINNSPGPTQYLNLTNALSSAPVVGAVWALSVSDMTMTTWRLLTVNEKWNDTEAYYEIEAVAHNPSKYAFVDTNSPMDFPRTISIPAVVTPSQLVGGEYQIRKSTGTITVLTANWSYQKDAVSYSVSYRRGSGNWIQAPDVDTSHFELEDVSLGAYTIRVNANYGGGMCSQPAECTYTVLGLTAPPASVTGLTATVGSFSISIKWNANTEPDISGYEIRSGSSWSNSTLIAKLNSTSYQWENQTPGSYTIWAKAIDTSGNYSTNAVSVVATPSTTTPSSITMSVSTTVPT